MTDLAWLERTQLLIGEEQLIRLNRSSVLIVGLGGVGSYAAEFVCRAGVGNITIVDGDVVDVTNKNRQLPALSSTVGKSKAAIMAERMIDINPNLKLTVIDTFQRPEDTSAMISENRYDYVMDCIDSISPKIYLIRSCVEHKQRFISSMGAGGKTDPSAVTVGDVSESYNCPFARLVRKRLHRQGIYRGFKVVYNHGPLYRNSLKLTDGSNFKKSFYGTISFMPALFGLRMAAEVINDLREL
ncbi:MAG: ThiF family adenylyltransferase [Sphingomonadales bacterium]|jgi:tRNA A37 threonylcarbamoyladenosine dehydratase